MAARFDQPVVRRPPLPLTERDERALALLRADTPEREALIRLAGASIPVDMSDGRLLHTLIDIALMKVHEEVEASGYAELARQRAATDGDHRAVARRRPPLWADEE